MIPVHGPADPEGLADLYKHPGILDFSQPFGAFERRQWGALAATALPLVHSKPTFGYLLEGLPRRDDTAPGLPHRYRRAAGGQRLAIARGAAGPAGAGLLDAAAGAAAAQPQRPHAGIGCIESLRPRRAVLTHVGHTLDAWLLDHPAALPEGVELARDGVCLPL